jgi:hypothetical protein
MKPVEHWTGVISADPRPEAIHQALLHFQAECFDHAAGLVDQGASEGRLPSELATLLRLHAQAVCPGQVSTSAR